MECAFSATEILKEKFYLLIFINIATPKLNTINWCRWHDAGTYNAETKTGGANGSIRNEHELGHGANSGLKIAVNFCGESFFLKLLSNRLLNYDFCCFLELRPILSCWTVWISEIGNFSVSRSWMVDFKQLEFSPWHFLVFCFDARGSESQIFENHVCGPLPGVLFWISPCSLQIIGFSLHLWSKEDRLK